MKKIFEIFKKNKWEKKYNYSNFQSFFNVLTKCQIDLEKNLSLLDFGCGDGRYSSIISKHFNNINLFGVDIDSNLIEYCNKNIKGSFKVNKIDPPLDFNENFFDLIIAYSVFTHLKKPKIEYWFKEFNRVLKVGGFAAFTFSSLDRLKFMKVFSPNEIKTSYGISNLDKFFREYNNYYYYEFDNKTPEYVNTILEIDLLEKLAEKNNLKLVKNFENVVHAYPFGTHNICVLKKIF